MKLYDVLDKRIQISDLCEFDRINLILSWLQQHDLTKVRFRDVVGTEFYVMFYEKGNLFLEPTYYRNEREAVQLRVPVTDLLNYEVM